MLFLTLAGIAALCLLISGLWPVALFCVAGLFYLNAWLSGVLLVGMAGLGFYLLYTKWR
jgi:hypothetical protein